MTGSSVVVGLPHPGARSGSGLVAVTYLAPGHPESLFAALAAAIGADLHLVTARSGPDPADDPFADGRVDLGWICGASYAELVARPHPSVGLVGVSWAPSDPDAGGEAVYWSDVVVRADSPAADLAELAERRIGANDPASLSGYHGLRLELQRRGLDPSTFGELVFTGGHRQSMDAVLAGELDAAAVDSVVRLRRQRDDRAASEGLRVVARCGPWPAQPLVARTGLPGSVVDRVRRVLLAEPPAPAIARELAAAGLARLAPVSDGDYRPLVDRLARSWEDPTPT